MKDSRGPTARDISKITKRRYSESEVIEAENVICEGIDWNLMFQTAPEFLNLIQNQGFIFTNDKIKIKQRDGSYEYQKPTQKVFSHLKKLIEFFADLCLSTEYFFNQDPFTLAVGIILLARKNQNITPIWNSEYDTMFDGPFEKYERIVRKIDSFYKKMIP